MGIEDGYRKCARVARRRARNFYYAFLFLPPEPRKALYALYAYCRRADDLTDGDLTAARAREGIAALRAELGEPASAEMEAFAHARRRFGIPDEPLEEVLRGVEMDVEPREYRTFDDLRLYCTRVASAVGLACLPVLGARDRAAKAPAVELGIAMQLTNILRDLKEDAARGRIYLPREDLEKFRVAPERLRTGDPPFPDLIAFEVARARGHFEEAEALYPHVPPRTRSCPVILAQLYRKLLDEMERRGYDVYRRRVSLSLTEKLSLSVRGALTRGRT